MGFSITGRGGGLDGAPFFWVRLDRDALRSLAEQLRGCAARERQWFTLAATYENPARLRLLDAPTPDFEGRAADVYLRGDILRITGTEHRSCNITFSSFAARTLAERVEAATRKMRDFVEIRVASRRHDLIEFVPDIALASPDESALARASEAEQAEALGAEDFSDWE